MKIDFIFIFRIFLKFILLHVKFELIIKMNKKSKSYKVFEWFRFIDIFIVNSLVYQIITTIVIRSLMLLICAFQLYILVCATGNITYLGLVILCILIIIDTILICILREGNERTW